MMVAHHGSYVLPCAGAAPAQPHASIPGCANRQRAREVARLLADVDVAATRAEAAAQACVQPIGSKSDLTTDGDSACDELLCYNRQAQEQPKGPGASLASADPDSVIGLPAAAKPCHGSHRCSPSRRLPGNSAAPTSRPPASASVPPVATNSEPGMCPLQAAEGYAAFEEQARCSDGSCSARALSPGDAALLLDVVDAIDSAPWRQPALSAASSHTVCGAAADGVAGVGMSSGASSAQASAAATSPLLLRSAAAQACTAVAAASGGPEVGGSGESLADALAAAEALQDSLHLSVGTTHCGEVPCQTESDRGVEPLGSVDRQVLDSTCQCPVLPKPEVQAQDDVRGSAASQSMPAHLELSTSQPALQQASVTSQETAAVAQHPAPQAAATENGAPRAATTAIGLRPQGPAVAPVMREDTAAPAPSAASAHCSRVPSRKVTPLGYVSLTIPDVGWQSPAHVTACDARAAAPPSGMRPGAPDTQWQDRAPSASDCADSEPTCPPFVCAQMGSPAVRDAVAVHSAVAACAILPLDARVMCERHNACSTRDAQACSAPGASGDAHGRPPSACDKRSPDGSRHDSLECTGTAQDRNSGSPRLSAAADSTPRSSMGHERDTGVHMPALALRGECAMEYARAHQQPLHRREESAWTVDSAQADPGVRRSQAAGAQATTGTGCLPEHMGHDIEPREDAHPAQKLRWRALRTAESGGVERGHSRRPEVQPWRYAAGRLHVTTPTPGEDAIQYSPGGSPPLQPRRMAGLRQRLRHRVVNGAQRIATAEVALAPVRVRWPGEAPRGGACPQGAARRAKTGVVQRLLRRAAEVRCLVRGERASAPAAANMAFSQK